MKWLKGKKSSTNTSGNIKSKKNPLNTGDINSDLFDFDDVQKQDLSNKEQQDIVSSSLDVTIKQDKPIRENDKNLEELSESVKDFKRNNFNKTGKKQTGLNFSKNIDNIVINNINGTKKGLSKNQGEITQEQIEILKKCKEQSSAAELRKISKRTNKTKFKKNVLDPLIDFGFFELTIPDSPKSPNQKYRLTGRFVRRIQKN